MAIVDNTLNNFIGKNISFPIVLDNTGKAVIDSGKNLIESSIRSILSTLVGTRFFLGEYGCRLELLLQEPNDNISSLIADFDIKNAIQTWDSRIIIKDVRVERKDDTKLNIFLTYNIRNTQIEDTMIYPYYSQIKY